MYIQAKKQSKSEKKTFDDSIDLYPDEADLYKWTAFINGPPDTPYLGGKFQLRIIVPQSYPHNPPTVKFITKVCHPNVHFKNGDICLDVLKDNWTPIWTLESTCRAVVTLLSVPEASSPLNCDCGNLIRCGDMEGYWSLAKMYTKEYAMHNMKSDDNDNSDDDNSDDE